MNYLNKTSTLLPKLGFVQNIFFGDGYKGLPLCSFDIIVTAGAPFIPQP
jgi:protein-L-isoaspartate O-methyltransferase